MLTLQDIRLRDPFVLPIRNEGLYYLYGSSDPNTWFGPGKGFDAYRSPDLETWEGPIQVFAPPEGFWGTKNFWAPEVYEIDGPFFMFATFRGTEGRGTAILAGDGPRGPFRPHSHGSVTPRGWNALDGTLFEDDRGDRWLVFCREWHEGQDGEVCARRLSKDLRTGVGEPVTLFAPSQAPWTSPIKGGRYVADGPCMYRSREGSLLMLWSSFGSFGYAQGIARAPSGELSGPWHHDRIPIWEADGGHGMLFRTFSDELRLILHHPNQTPYERALLLAVSERDGEVMIRPRLAPVVTVLQRFNRGGSRRQKLRFLSQFVRRRLGMGGRL